MTTARIHPTRPQFDYIQSKAQFPALVAGFGAGKTEAAILRSVLGILANPSTNRGFYEPTYDLIRMIAWPRFEEILDSLGIPYVLRKHPLNLIDIEGYGKVFFRSMDNPHRIVGYEHADADIDELDTLKPDDAAKVWRQVMARNRQNKPSGEPNTIGVTTTPEGFRFVYETWKKNPKSGYEIIQAPTYSNPHLPSGYIDSLRDAYPANLLDAYLEGRFVNLISGTVYASYDRTAHDSQETIKEGEPLFIGCDFNVTQQAATVYVQREGGAVWHSVAELTNMYDTPEMISIIKEKWQNKGHKIHIYPDASGGSRKTVNASLSDIALLQQAGFTVRAKKSNPAVRDRVMAMNAALEAGRIRINARACPRTAECLEQQVYKNGEPDKSSGNDHQNDATTYPIAYEMPIIKPVSNVEFNFAL
jgi:PBSX family phage terminase large subunit